MAVSGEAIVLAVRRAVEATGVHVEADEVIARRRLEAAVEVEARSLDRCTCCGELDWDEDDDD